MFSFISTNASDCRSEDRRFDSWLLDFVLFHNSPVWLIQDTYHVRTMKLIDCKLISTYDKNFYSLCNMYYLIGPVAQWITRLTTDQKILGSTPGWLECNFFYIQRFSKYQSCLRASLRGALCNIPYFSILLVSLLAEKCSGGRSTSICYLSIQQCKNTALQVKVLHSQSY